MLPEEAFNRHPRPQMPFVPTHGALRMRKTQKDANSAKMDNTIRALPSINTRAEFNPKERRSMRRSAITHAEPLELVRESSSVSPLLAPLPAYLKSGKKTLPSVSSTGPTKIFNTSDEAMPLSSPMAPPPVHLDSSKAVIQRLSAESVSCTSVILSPSSNPVIEAHDTYVCTQDGPPWDRLRPLGTLVQGVSELTVCIDEDKIQKMAMVKRSDRFFGLKEAAMLKKLSHPNIIGLLDVFMDGEEVYIGLEYCRFTLEEVMNVHIRFEEPHMRFIAHSLFAAVSYLSSHQIVHGNINLHSTRVCGRSMAIKLADFDTASFFDGEVPNTDLEQLGLLLLQCMDVPNAVQHTNVGHVRQQRSINKVFGLKNPERWSAAKQLMDFLDDLFSESKSAYAKLEKPHPYVRGDVSSGFLLPFLELAALGSFVLWREKAW